MALPYGDWVNWTPPFQNAWKELVGDALDAGLIDPIYEYGDLEILFRRGIVDSIGHYNADAVKVLPDGRVRPIDPHYEPVREDLYDALGMTESGFWAEFRVGYG